MDCTECAYEQRCFPLLKFLHRFSQICNQSRQRNRQTTLDEAQKKQEKLEEQP